MKKSERINQELFYLNNKKEFNLKELMREFNISKSTALRDISELEELGVPLYATFGRYGSYHIIRESILPPVHFSEKEILSIFFSLQLLKTMLNSPFDHSYEGIKTKLINSFPKEKQNNIKKSLELVRYDGVLQSENVENLELLFEGIFKKRTLSFTYDRGRKEKRMVYPMRLTIRNGYWYCLGFDLDKQSYRTFRCDFIRAVSQNAEKIVALSQDDMEKGLLNQQKEYRFLKFKVEVSKEAKTFYQTHHYASISFKTKGNLCFLVGEINPSELQFLANYLLGYGNSIKSIYPIELRKEYIRLVNTIQKNIDNMNDTD